jgi:UDP-glucuronate 4-epimerase
MTSYKYTLLLTGSAGFIGSHLCIKLLNKGFNIVGVDNHNNYYDPTLKEKRISKFLDNQKYVHYKADLCDEKKLKEIFNIHKPNIVINLAAQAGVRYSIENPKEYINSNIVGFLNLIENCRDHEIKHFLYASTSSVYGDNKNMPFVENDNTDYPLSLYAATKKSNELIAHSYSSLYGIPTTGLRFFTVYGPWGRPDMALFKFTDKMIKGHPIDVFNNGNHTRDFTYIDDIIESISRLVNLPPSLNNKNQEQSSISPFWTVFNIGNNNPIKIMNYIHALENSLSIKAKINYLPLQKGDVPDTFADTSKLKNKINFSPSTSVEEGVNKFVQWYLQYYK